MSLCRPFTVLNCSFMCTNFPLLLGRNPDYVRLNVQYTIDLVASANKIRRYPWFLKP